MESSSKRSKSKKNRRDNEADQSDVSTHSWTDYLGGFMDTFVSAKYCCAERSSDNREIPSMLDGFVSGDHCCTERRLDYREDRSMSRKKREGRKHRNAGQQISSPQGFSPTASPATSNQFRPPWVQSGAPPQTQYFHGPPPWQQPGTASPNMPCAQPWPSYVPTEPPRDASPAPPPPSVRLQSPASKPNNVQLLSPSATGAKPQPQVSTLITVAEPTNEPNKESSKELNTVPQTRRSRVSRSSNSRVSTSRLPDDWSWPSWCFQKSPPCIEVYVYDEESGQSKWVLATPEDRVVDKDGHDAFISAEYEWNSADFVQDFGPDHVRRLGEVLTIADLLEVL